MSPRHPRFGSTFTIVVIAVAALLAGCGASAISTDGHPRPPAPLQRDLDGASVRWVSPEGDDAAPGSQARPWRTLTRGLRDAEPGTILVLADGTYRGSVATDAAGTEAQPIVVTSAPDGRAVIAADGDFALQVGSGAAHITFDGVDFTGAVGASSANIYVSGDAHDITFRACEVSGSARQGFFSEQDTKRVTVEACVFHDNGGTGPDNQDHNMYVGGEGHRIVNNAVMRAHNGYGIQVYPVARNVVVANNTVVDNRGGIIVGGYDRTAANNITVTGNIVAHNQDVGLTSYWGGGPEDAGNRITGNIVDRNGRNIDTSAGGAEFGDNPSGDPRFVDLANGDLRLREGGPAIDTAPPEFAPDTDFTGDARDDGSPDIGAFEFR